MKNIFIAVDLVFWLSSHRIFGRLGFKVTALIEYNSFHDYGWLKELKEKAKRDKFYIWRY